MAGSVGRRGGAAAYHRSAQAWAVAALLAVLLPPAVRLGWWLPLHLALLGAVSQAIVGGQLQFSSALTKARPATLTGPLIRLATLNVGALAIVIGRVSGSATAVVVGAALFTSAILWAASSIERMWRSSINPRFTLTRGAYLFANVSIVAGAALGAALGAGVFSSGASYASHRLAHLSLNLLGWAGLTIMGTMVTFLPTVLHVRVPQVRGVGGIAPLAFTGVATIATGLMTGMRGMAAAGGLAFIAALVLLGRYVRAVLLQSRARTIPGVALHLIAALGWMVIVAVVQVPLLALGEQAALRDVWVIGAGGGLAIQAVLGAWAFLLPMTRGSAPAGKGRELVAFELGARTQVFAYNAGLAITLLSLGGLLPDAAGAAGIAMVWVAAAWALAKSVLFPWLARTTRVGAAAEVWWQRREPVPHHAGRSPS